MTLSSCRFQNIYLSSNPTRHSLKIEWNSKLNNKSTVGLKNAKLTLYLHSVWIFSRYHIHMSFFHGVLSRVLFNFVSKCIPIFSFIICEITAKRIDFCASSANAFFAMKCTDIFNINTNPKLLIHFIYEEKKQFFLNLYWTVYMYIVCVYTLGPITN